MTTAIDIDIAEVAQGYIDAVLFADCQPDCGCEPQTCHCESGGMNHLEPTDDMREYVTILCGLFVSRHRADCEAYCEQFGGWSGATDSLGRSEYSPSECLGHDISMTSRGHGVGFWDRDLGDLGERLTTAASTDPFDRTGGGDVWEQGGAVHMDTYPLTE